MQKRFALLFLLIFVLALAPAYYPPDDETARLTSPLSGDYSQLFTPTGTLSDFNHDQSWTGVSLSWDIPYLFPQYVRSLTAARAPPAQLLLFFPNL
jgi:hypothetical protein